MRLPRQPLLVAAALLAGAAPATAQRLLVPHDSPRAMVALVDVNAGALFDSAWIDVENTAEPPLTSSNVLVQAERVGDEVWVAGGLWVYRYDIQSRELIASFEARSPVRSIEQQDGRVLLTTFDEIEVRALDGSFLADLPISGASDTLALGDGTMLVARRTLARVDLFSTGGAFLGVFAGPSVPTPFGILSRPLQLSRMRDGRILVCGDVRAYVFETTGSFVQEIDAGPFEGGISDTFSGRLFITLGTGMALHDLATGATATIGGPFFGQGRKVGVLDRGDAASIGPGDPSSAVTCPGGINSTGRRARVAPIGSSLATDRLLGLHGDRLPSLALTLPLLARESDVLPLGGGFLCLDRRTLTTPLRPIVADEFGTVEAVLVRGPSAVVAPLPGSTLHMQLAYRDGGPLLVSDAVRVTFGN